MSEPPALCQFVGLDHVVIRCRDLEPMIRFYRDALGCGIERRNEPLGLVHLRAGASLIDLVAVDGPLGKKGGAAPGPEARNLDHFCLRIRQFDFEALRTHFARFGTEPDQVHVNYGAQGTGPSIYVSDPEGNVIELKAESPDAPPGGSR